MWNLFYKKVVYVSWIKLMMMYDCFIIYCNFVSYVEIWLCVYDFLDGLC